MMQALNRTESGVLEFCPLASGSSGNCIYLSSGNASVLIDAGLSGIRIERALSAIGVQPQELDAIFITHEHSDHISGAGVMARRYGVPLFATAGTWDYIDRTGTLGKIKREQRRLVQGGVAADFIDISVKPFAIPHDANEPVGYSFCTMDAKAVIATDIGFFNPDCRAAVNGADVLLIEANHDVEMLKNGSYPFYLKKRILSDFGHLSNVSCGAALVETEKKPRHVYLGHLSEENNRPMLAFETVKDILEEAGVRVNSETTQGTGQRLTSIANMADSIRLYMADRYTVSKHLIINKTTDIKEA